MGRSDTPENRVKAEVLKYLKLRRIKAWNNPTGAVRVALDRWLHFGLKGSADILGILPGGRFLAVECKAPDGRLSPNSGSSWPTPKLWAVCRLWQSPGRI
jgi:hypothetical protein